MRIKYLKSDRETPQIFHKNVIQSVFLISSEKN